MGFACSKVVFLWNSLHCPFLRLLSAKSSFLELGRRNKSANDLSLFLGDGGGGKPLEHDGHDDVEIFDGVKSSGQSEVKPPDAEFVFGEEVEWEVAGKRLTSIPPVYCVSYRDVCSDAFSEDFIELLGLRALREAGDEELWVRDLGKNAEHGISIGEVTNVDGTERVEITEK